MQEIPTIHQEGLDTSQKFVTRPKYSLAYESNFVNTILCIQEGFLTTSSHQARATELCQGLEQREKGFKYL